MIGCIVRGVAQLGSAPALGAGCRRFESCHPDQNSMVPTGRRGVFCLCYGMGFNYWLPKQVPVLGKQSDRCRWQGEGGLVGVAVKIQQSVKRAVNFGHRKRRRSRGCRRFESCHPDHVEAKFALLRLFYAKKSSARFLASPLSQKVTLGSSVRL